MKETPSVNFSKQLFQGFISKVGTRRKESASSLEKDKHTDVNRIKIGNFVIIKMLLQTNVHSMNTNNIGSPDLSNGDNDNNEEENRANDVYIMNPKHEDRATSFFAQPGILAGHYFIQITRLLTYVFKPLQL